MPITPSKPKKNLILRIDAHYRLYIALLVGAIVCMCFRHLPSIPSVILITWIAFSLVIIILDWITIMWAHPREVRKIASLQDSSRTLIFLFVIGASLISMVAILLLLKATKGHADTVTSHILLAMAAVIVSWWLVHTIFAIRYAHLFYETVTDDNKNKVVGGLQFPEEKEPDYLDFVYFSFVIGMTFQVSDVEISSRNIRRLAWLHGLISFAFNTAIVALSINVISGLVSQ